MHEYVHACNFTDFYTEYCDPKYGDRQITKENVSTSILCGNVFTSHGFYSNHLVLFSAVYLWKMPTAKITLRDIRMNDPRTLSDVLCLTV